MSEDREQNIGKFFIANAISRVLHVPATEGLSILSKLKISIRAKAGVVGSRGEGTSSKETALLHLFRKHDQVEEKLRLVSFVKSAFYQQNHAGALK